MTLSRQIERIKLRLRLEIVQMLNYVRYRPKAIAEVPPEHYLSIACIVKNEGIYIREWIEYHLWAGVEHFYIYDNGSTDNTRDILAPYIQSGVATYHYWVVEEKGWWGSQQIRAYNDALARYKYCTRWLALIDADEFYRAFRRGESAIWQREGGI